MRVGLLLIGDELLSGKIKDRNGYLVAKTCFSRGFELQEIRVVSDQVEVIAGAIKTMSEAVDVMITSGGIGPTHDDKTFAALSAAFDSPLELHEPTRAKLESFLEGRNQELNVARLKMVSFPKGAKVENFPHIWLPLVSFHNIFVLPGVPSLFEMLLKPVFDRFAGNPKSIIELGTQTPEGDLAQDLEKALEKWPDVQIGSYPKEKGSPHRVVISIEGINGSQVMAAAVWLKQRLSAVEIGS